VVSHRELGTVTALSLSGLHKQLAARDTATRLRAPTRAGFLNFFCFVFCLFRTISRKSQCPKLSCLLPDRFLFRPVFGHSFAAFPHLFFFLEGCFCAYALFLAVSHFTLHSRNKHQRTAALFVPT
jgi:hypothetical protein